MSLICDICGAEFKPKAWNQKRCSPECSREWRKRYSKAYRKSHPGKHKKLSRVCPICGAEFVTSKMQVRYCPACRNDVKGKQKIASQERRRRLHEYLCSKRHGGCGNCDEEDCVL